MDAYYHKRVDVYDQVDWREDTRVDTQPRVGAAVRRPLRRLGTGAVMAAVCAVALAASVYLAADSVGVVAGQGGSLVAQTNDQIKAWKEKWHQKFLEQQKRGFTTGTIDEYLAEGRRHYMVIYRTASSLVFRTPYPDDVNDVFVIFQVRSIQGRDLLLGPSTFWVYHTSPQAILAKWKIQDPRIEFDETMHYAKYYFDSLNEAPMFAIWRKVPGGEPVPIQALFYPQRVKVPNLVSARQDPNAYRGRASMLPDLVHEINKWLGNLE